MTSPHERVDAEIRRLHRFLENWLNGTLPGTEDELEKHLTSRLHPEFFNIQPAGIVLTRDALVRQIRFGHGASPDFAIHIRNVTVRHHVDAHRVIATYEEYQRGAQKSARANNARLSTALFDLTAEDAIWHFIQETWLPEANHAEENFQF